jgi:hypothetical protein
LARPYQALGLPGYTAGDLPIRYYGQEYRLRRSDHVIYLAEAPEARVDFTTGMAIYHLFHFSKQTPKNCGRFIPFRDVKRAGPFEKAFIKTTLEPFARAFNGRTDRMISACEKLGFTRLPVSDAGFEAAAFECMPIRFLFWDGDDEFGAQANILFDENITDFTHEETVVTIADDGARRIMDAAGQ